jgi:hypothetical protein
MKNIIANLLGGINYFGSSSVNSPEFNKFFNAFKRVMKKELEGVGATDFKMSKGHFYLSGFFRIGEQLIYFSISDVRHGFGFNRSGQPEMLVRTAQHNKDFSGGANNYVVIEEGIAENIKRKFSL